MDRKFFSYTVVVLVFSMLMLIPLGSSAKSPSSTASTTWGNIKKCNSTEAQLAPLSCITEESLSLRILGKVYKVTQRFGDQLPPAVGPGLHAGIDYASTATSNINGTSVKSATYGTVIKIDPNNGIVYVFDGTNTILYVHMNVSARAYYVNVGTKVIPGTILGAVSNKTSLNIVMGYHLHLEVRKGYTLLATALDATKAVLELKNVNPTYYIK